MAKDLKQPASDDYFVDFLHEFRDPSRSTIAVVFFCLASNWLLKNIFVNLATVVATGVRLLSDDLDFAQVAVPPEPLVVFSNRPPSKYLRHYMAKNGNFIFQ